MFNVSNKGRTLFYPTRWMKPEIYSRYFCLSKFVNNQFEGFDKMKITKNLSNTVDQESKDNTVEFVTSNVTEAISYQPFLDLDLVTNVDKFVYPPDGHTFFTEASIYPLPLFVRKCYSKLYDLIKNSDDKGMLLLGSPGIGKSWFMNYLIVRLLQDGHAVLFQSALQKKVWLFKDGIMTVKWFFEDSLIAELFDSLVSNPKNSFYLYDLGGPTSLEPILVPVKTILTTPLHQQQIYGSWSQAVFASTFYIPCYDYDEIKLTMNVPDDNIDSKYDFVGGCPRNFRDNGEDIFKALEQAIETYSYNSKELVWSERSTELTRLNNAIDYLFKYNVNERFQNKTGISFISPLIERKVFHHFYLRAFKLEAKKILYDRDFYDSNGKVFHDVVQNLLITVGGSYELKRFAKCYYLCPMKILNVPTKIECVKRFDDLKDNTVFIPESLYSPAIDLILEQDKYIFLINVTVSVTPSYEVSKEIELKKKKIILLWAIPEYLSNEFCPQIGESYDQFKMIIPLNFDHQIWRDWTHNNDDEWNSAVEKLRSLPRSSSQMF